MNYELDLPAFDGVGSGQKASMNVPIGPLYKSITLRIANTAGAAFDSVVDFIEVTVNGKIQRIFTAAQLDYLNGLNGAIYGVVHAGTNTTPGNAGYMALLTINFQESWWKEIFHQELFAWGSGNLGKFQIYVKLKATTAPTLSAYADVAQKLVTVDGKTIQQPLGKIIKVYQNDFAIVGVTQKLKTPFKLPSPDKLHCIHVFDEDITKLTLRNGRTVMVERTKQENDAKLKRFGLVPTAAVFSLVFDADNLPENSLGMDVIDGVPVQDLTLQLDTSDGTPRSIPVLYEVWGQPD